MSGDDDKTRASARTPGTDSAGPLTAAPASVAQIVMNTPQSDAAQAPPSAYMRPAAPNALATGFVLREFEIERVIGEGGFSIVYLAIDRQLARRVAIKEYLPNALAFRTQNLTIVARSERLRPTFEAGLRSFVNEARLLAQFDHPALVKVYRFWEERGTAYMVMPYYQGITLSQWRRLHGAADEAWLRHLLDALLEALEKLHAHNCYHRDIAPDNILLLPGDQPVLLDFGAARQIIGDMTQALTVILKPGYAPVEQYAEIASMKQGAWTDLYALAAVLYFVIAGHAPPQAVGRMVNDELRPAREVGAGGYSIELLGAIDAALSVLPEDRPQNIAAFRLLLSDATRVRARPGGGATPALGVLPTEGTGATRQPARIEPTGFPAERSYAAMYGDPATLTPTPPPRRSLVLIVGAVVVVLAVLFLLFRPSSKVAPQADATPAVGAVSMPATSHEMLQRVFDARSPSIQVRAAASAASMRIGHDELRFGLASNVGGYVYVLLAGTDNNHLWLLFPNASDNDNRIEASATLLLPRPTWRVYAAGPAGTNRLLVLVSPQPRDFSTAGLRIGEPFSEFSQTALLAALARDGPTALVGSAECPAGAGNCDTSFGAAMFEVTEVDAPDPVPAAKK